jgi:hypothetical protein
MTSSRRHLLFLQDSCNASGDHQTAFAEYGKMRHRARALDLVVFSLRWGTSRSPGKTTL